MRTIPGFIWLSVMSISFSTALSAEENDAPSQRDDKEQAFIALLSGSTLVGHFTIDGQDNSKLKPERYEIAAVRKDANGQWFVDARIKYGKVDATVPVPVDVQWAGDTPLILVTDLTIPLVGSEFSARVLFHDGRYAGTWKHGKIGGHMWGTIEPPLAPQPPANP